ncbi:tetratricopeptide repeat protein, partial [bacterium]|nr:tetratricopeptide repeat protein [bacterium]
MEEIKKMSKVSGFDSPDHGKIYQKICHILRQASNTKFAQMAHWKILPYYRGLLDKEDHDAAQATLESYLYKYDANEFLKREAYDKLSMFAAEKKDWGLALFYCDKYLELKPNHYPVLLNKARALIKLGAKAEGKKLLEKIVAESPGTVQYNLAQMELDNLAISVKPADVQAKYTQTLSLIKNVAMAVDNYHVDMMNLPKSLTELTPDFIKETNLQDAWGTPLFYEASKDG